MESNKRHGHHITDRYLKMLRIKREEPSLEYLISLVHSQLQYVPYENISKVLRLKENKIGIPDFEEFLDLNDEFGFGGTCYVQNGHFVTLLKGLGFQAEILGVGLESDSATHPTCRVHIDSKSFIIALGNCSSFAGPFSLEPGTVVEAKIADWSYRYQATVERTHQMYTERGGEAGRTHRSHPPVRELSFFEPAMLKSFGKEAIFMKTIVCHRVLKMTPVLQWGATLVETEFGELKKTKLKNIEDFERVYKNVFQLPKFPVREAILFLREWNGIDLFGSNNGLSGARSCFWTQSRTKCS